MKIYKALRYSLIAVETAVTLVIVAALAGWGTAAVAGHALASVQIVPALAAASLAWLIVWFAVTVMFGRLYCSAVCPLGALQDGVSAIAMRLRRPEARHYRYARPRRGLRGATLAFVAACVLLGIPAVWSLFDPYSAFARMVTCLLDPILPGSRIVAVSVAGCTVAALTLVAVAAVAAAAGRTLCNTVCPVGTALGCLSRYSVYHFDINTDLCTQCRRCVDVCHASCINIDDHTIDHSRCLSCFRCAAECPAGAITFRRGRHRLSIPMMQPVAGVAPTAEASAPASADACSDSRRRFIATAALGGVAALAARVSASQPGRPLNYVTPPGTSTREDFLKRCTACGACVTRCPAGVLVPSVRQYGLANALRPVMDYDVSFCRYDCVACTQVCPSGALKPLTVAEKHSAVIGKARIDLDRCVAYTEAEVCGRCARICPRRAIAMRPVGGRAAPVLDFEACIGCGACSYVCPAEPVKAIVVEGS